jgi:hypothetical protein
MTDYLLYQFGATVFNSYAGFNLAYALVYLPGSGIIAAYVDPKTGEPAPEFAQSLAMFVWAWFIVSVIFTIAATRSSWVLLILLVFVDITFLFIASSYMADVPQLLTAASATGFVAAFLACKSSLALFWSRSDCLLELETDKDRLLQTGRAQQDFSATAPLPSTCQLVLCTSAWSNFASGLYKAFSSFTKSNMLFKRFCQNQDRPMPDPF